MNTQTSHRPSRGHKRLMGCWSANLHVSGRDLPTTCVDISQGGARVQSRLPLRVGQMFVLTIHTRDQGELVCLAQARWVCPDEGEIGVEFTGIAADAADRLSHMVTFPTTETYTWRPWPERVLDAIERAARWALPAPLAPPTEAELLLEHLEVLSAGGRRIAH